MLIACVYIDRYHIVFFLHVNTIDELYIDLLINIYILLINQAIFAPKNTNARKRLRTFPEHLFCNSIKYLEINNHLNNTMFFCEDLRDKKIHFIGVYCKIRGYNG